MTAARRPALILCAPPRLPFTTRAKTPTRLRRPRPAYSPCRHRDSALTSVGPPLSYYAHAHAYWCRCHILVDCQSAMILTALVRALQVNVVRAFRADLDESWAGLGQVFCPQSTRSKKVSARARRHSNFRAGGEARRGACSTHPRLHPDGVGGLDGTQLINDRRGSAGVQGCTPHPCTPSIRLTVNGVRIDASRTGPRAVKARRGPTPS